MRVTSKRILSLMAALMLVGVLACSGSTTSSDNATTDPTRVQTQAPTTDPTRSTEVGETSTSAKSKSSKSSDESAPSEESDTSESEDDGHTSFAPAPEAPGTADTAAVSCPSSTVSVSDAESLTEALSSAGPGTVIQLADGTFPGTFAATVSGTAESPIWVCGGPGAIIDGGSVEDGYAFHVKDADYWHLVGFSVLHAQKGVMVDSGTGIVIQGLTVSDIGDEAIHLRAGTTFSLVRDNTVFDTGQRKEKYGEGIYIGSATSNWCTYSDCGPDRSNNNAIVGNRIRGTSAEAIDIKEGTQDGLIQGNTFDGSGGLTGADSWVDVKGNNWQIIGNSGTNSPVDGFQVHSIEKGWGMGNVFQGNTADVNGSGFGFHLAPIQDNTVSCDNTATGAASGLTNTTCV